MTRNFKPRVRLHMKPNIGHTLDGLLVSKRAGHYRLVDVTVIEAEGRSILGEGEWYVPRENVHAVQVLYK